MKLLWEKYNLPEADDDGRMLFLHNELLLYNLKCKWNKEIGQFLVKNF